VIRSLQDWESLFANKHLVLTNRDKAGAWLAMIPAREEWDAFVLSVQQDWWTWEHYPEKYPTSLVVLYDGVAFFEMDEAEYWPHFARTVGRAAMGWQNSHMHSFKIGGVYYTSKQMSEMEDMDMERDDRVLLRDVAGRPKQKFLYEYDPGDSWEHDIVAEKVLPIDPQAKYPICLAGARACPPEDCGSFPGYMSVLEALKSPKKNEEQKELLEWLGDGYDPEHFDLEAVNRALAGK
jgi:hypothetical protein